MTDSFKIPLIEIPDTSVLNFKKWLTIVGGILVLAFASFFTYQSVYLGIPIEGSVLFNIFFLPFLLVIISISQKPSYILKSFNYPNFNFVLFPFICVKFVNHSGAMLNKFAFLKEKITSSKPENLNGLSIFKWMDTLLNTKQTFSNLLSP